MAEKGLCGFSMTKKTEKIIIGKKAPPYGKAPAIILINPKYARNVGVAVRVASCYGVNQVWYTGNRVQIDIDSGRRLPREERMKGYQEVEYIQYDRPFDQFPSGVTPVANEDREKSENQVEFEHPENAVYVFGPEDGSIPRVYLQHCHRFVVIPTRHCLNLATAVSTVLYDRLLKRHWNGEESGLITPGEFEGRGQIEDLDELNFVHGK